MDARRPVKGCCSRQGLGDKTGWFGQGGGSEAGEKWTDLRYMLKVEATRLYNRFTVEGNRKK